jgi:hypothetical protein
MPIAGLELQDTIARDTKDQQVGQLEHLIQLKEIQGEAIEPRYDYPMRLNRQASHSQVILNIQSKMLRLIHQTEILNENELSNCPISSFENLDVNLTVAYL